MLKKYIKNSPVEAIQYTGENKYEILAIGGNKILVNTCSSDLTIVTLEGNVVLKINDYLCKGIENEFWPVKQSIFEKTYVEYKR